MSFYHIENNIKHLIRTLEDGTASNSHTAKKLKEILEVYLSEKSYRLRDILDRYFIEKQEEE